MGAVMSNKICPLCNYNKDKPIGVVIDNEQDEMVKIELNLNGIAGTFCPKKHIKRCDD